MVDGGICSRVLVEQRVLAISHCLLFGRARFWPAGGCPTEPGRTQILTAPHTHRHADSCPPLESVDEAAVARVVRLFFLHQGVRPRFVHRLLHNLGLHRPTAAYIPPPADR